MRTFGVLTSGGDAPGMNAAIRAVVRSGIEKGYKMLGIRYGYNGLINGDMIEMDRRSVSDIINKGGTVLCTARCKEFQLEEGLVKAKKVCEDVSLEGLVTIGGDGTFRGAADLSARGIRCIGIPGTIDNDISCTDYTIGYDTAVNTSVEMVDKLRDTTQSHERCSVVEVMGNRAGYIALQTGISCGATAILVPEIPMTREEIIGKIKRARALGKRHYIILVSEMIFDVHELSKFIEEETGISARATVLGHVQRGGSPSAHDRVVASEMGFAAMELLSKGIGNRVVAMRDNKIVDFDIQEALSMKKPFDMELYRIAQEIGF